MKGAMVILAVILILSVFGVMLTGIQDANTDERTDAFSAVTTGVGETTAEVKLVAELYDSDLLHVVSISSDDDSESPLPDSYATLNNTLTVRGLATNSTRSLEVTYRYGALTGDSENAGVFLRIIPFIGAFALVFLIIAAVYSEWQKRRG